jgi:hypothetical protein
MAEIVNITPLNPTTFEYQEYSTEDNSLITSLEIETSFTPGVDIIEYFIYDLNGDIIFEDVNGYGGYSLIDNVLTLDPQADLITQGYTEGQYNTVYNFVSPKLSSNSTDTYFITQVSPDRTEIRLDTTSIPNAFVISSSLELMNDVANSTGSYYDFYLDFGFNQLVIANNILLDTSSIDNPTVLIKLYDPLPSEFDINSQCWVVTQVATSVAYNVNITQTFEFIDESIQLRGPNTNLSIQDQLNNSTEYNNLNQLNTTNTSQGTGSLQYQLNSMLADTGIEINVDYSDYSNFIHFSSAQTRLENFYYKLSLLETYQQSASLSSGTPTNYYVSSSNIIWQNKINEIITGFDGYEYYLYYTSGSTSWPKTGPTPPYTNVTTGSVAGIAWFVSQSYVAETYDIENNNALINAIPSYLLEDPDNAQYELFIEMIAQYFDTVFLYTQDITNKYNADNRINYGVSKDIVADILRDMGIKIYQNNFSTNDLYSALLGFTPSGSLYNLPYTTGSLPTPTGYEYINTYITASATGSLVPTEDINAEIYKRIYANLPYLLKKKGTVEGLRALITVYGIPDTILQVNEFGGQDKIIENDYDLWFDQYNYAYYTTGSSLISSSFELSTQWNAVDNVPHAVEFRFKTNGLPQNTASITDQILWETDGGIRLDLIYTGSGYTSGSYSGSIPNPYNHFAKLVFTPDPTDINTTASVYLPFYDGEWWSVLVNKEGSKYTIYAGDKNYSGSDTNYVNYLSSSSITQFNEDPWNNSTTSYFATTYSGSFQEIRYYTIALSQSSFEDYIMNPYSIDSNGVNTAPDTLVFRASLGGELYTSSLSIHPKVTGSWTTTSSFYTGVSSFYTSSGGIYISNTESIYLNQFPSGIKNRVSNKVRQQNEVLPYSGSSEVNLPTNQVLSPFISIQQNVAVSGSYTPNIDYIEVAFSPQNEINNDIADQLGYFNIGEYIGDPRLVSSSAESYPALDLIRNYYFEKYTSNYNIWDYIRLIKYFDNSLFKMIQDWIPARTDAATGIVIKQTVLERNKYPVPQPNITSSIAMVGSGSTNIPFLTENILITGSPVQMYEITGSTGGTMPNLFGLTSSQYTGNNVVNITQVWTGSTPSLSGSVLFTQSSQIEFFNGELSGSFIQVDNGELNEANPVKYASTQILSYASSGSTSTTPPVGTFTWQSSIGYNGIAYSLYVSSLYINEVDLNGLNIQESLGNLEAGDTLTFKVTGDVFDPSTSNDYAYTNPIVTGLITSVVAVSPTVWKINFNQNLGFQATYYYSTVNPYIPSGPSAWTDNKGSNSSTTFFMNPYIGEIPNWNNSYYNVLINNAVVSRPNTEFFDVDYSTSGIVAVNKNIIISASRGTGSATPSTVPASNYTTARIANPRYKGSRTTSPIGSISQNYVNQQMTTGSTIGALANVESYCNWFAYFDTINPVSIAVDIYNSGWAGAVASGSAVHVLSLININGERIDLSPSNNLTSSIPSSTGSLPANTNPYFPNPLTSNIPILSSIFPFNIGSINGTKFTPVSIRQYVTSGSISVISGSFSTYNVISTGVQPLFSSVGNFNSVYGIPNETIVVLATGSFITPTGNTPGLLVPGNFNPNYQSSLLQIAQKAGFLNNI